MLYKLIILIQLFSQSAHANFRCDLLSNLDNPLISSNENFWKEFGELSNGKKNDRNLEELFKKYGVDTSKNGNTQSAPTRTTSLSSTKKADKEIRNLKGATKKNFEEFMEIMANKTGMKKLYENPGRWHMEKLKTGDDLYTVRLNSDVRVLFKVQGDDINIMGVNADDIHKI